MPSASEKLAGFLNVLRDTGTELPLRNSEIANLLKAALENFDLDSHMEFRDLPRKKLKALETVKENLGSDLDVMIEAFQFSEEEDDDEQFPDDGNNDEEE